METETETQVIVEQRDIDGERFEAVAHNDLQLGDITMSYGQPYMLVAITERNIEGLPTRGSVVDSSYERLERFGLWTSDPYWRKVEHPVVVDDSLNLKAELETLRERLTQAHIANDGLREDFEMLGERLLTEARDRDWCSEYDSVVDELNNRMRYLSLPQRSRTFEITFHTGIHAGCEDDFLAALERWVDGYDDTDGDSGSYRYGTA